MSPLVVIEALPMLGLDAALEAVETVARAYPGDCRIAIETPLGRRMTLGPAWTVDASPACLADLAKLGDPRVIAEP